MKTLNGFNLSTAASLFGVAKILRISLTLNVANASLSSLGKKLFLINVGSGFGL